MYSRTYIHSFVRIYSVAYIIVATKMSINKEKEGGGSDAGGGSSSPSSGRLNSGHSMVFKMQLAMGSIPLWLMAIVGGQASSIYSLVFNCNVGILGAILVVIAIVDTVFNPLAGYFQDKEWLSRCFPSASWGRRAPWYITHVPIAILCTFLVFVPPQSESGGNAKFETYCWFAFVSILAKWVTTVCWIANGAASDEIFPAQDERVQLYGMRVVTIWVAALVGVVAVNIVVGDADNAPDRCCGAEFTENLPSSCKTIVNETTGSEMYVIESSDGVNDMSTTTTMAIVCVAFSLVGLFAISPMRMAKQPADLDKVERMWQSLQAFLKWRPFLYLFVVTCLDALCGQILTVIAPFFMAYVIALDRDEYSRVLILTTVLGMIAHLFAAAVCVWVFGTESERSKTKSINPRVSAMVACVFFAVSQPVLIALTDLGYEDDDKTKKRGEVFYIVASFVASRFTLAPLRTFTTAARGWLVDLDVQKSQGGRREALVNGILLISINLSGILAMLVLTSLSWAGIDTSKCWGENQSKGGVMYVKFLFMAVIPLLMLFCAVFIWLFPIHGDVLKNLENKQARTYVKTPTSTPGRSKVHPTPGGD